MTSPGREKRLPLLRRQGGAVSGCLLAVLFLSVLGYFGFKFGEAYWEYLQARQKIREALNWAVAGSPKPETEIIQKVLLNVQEAGVELTARNVRITHTPQHLVVSAAWLRDVEFPYYTLPLKFEVSLQEVKRWYRGGLIVKGS